MSRLLALLALLALLVPTTLGAASLSLTAYFEKYSEIIPRTKIAQRMEQMYSLLDAAGKAQARTVLKADLLAQTAANKALATASYIDPMTAIETDVNDTTLP